MLDTLISSKTRIKLLLKFFLNSSSTAYLRGLETEFGESTNAIRLELNRFEEAGMLVTEKEGNKKIFKANVQHPLFGDIQRMLQKYIGIDQIVETLIERLGNVQCVYIEGQFAKGLNAEVIDLIIVSNELDRQYLTQLIRKVEPLIKKHIRYVVLKKEEEQTYLNQQETRPLLIWSG